MSFSLLSHDNYKQYLAARRELRAVGPVVDHALRQRVIDDPSLVRFGIVAHRLAERFSKSVDAGALSIDRSVTSAATKVSAAIETSQRAVVEALSSSQQAITDAVEAGTDRTVRALEVLSFDVKSVENEIARQTEVFDWGMTRMVAALGDVNATLEDLRKLAKTPSQTWAYEQFDIAREAFRRGLAEDALLALDRAANGFGTQTGFPLEPRFHYLKGTIRLGGNEREFDKYIDLDEAVSAFARSAAVCDPKDVQRKSIALCGAGYAALCNRKPNEAQGFLEDATGLDAYNGEAWFLRAKLAVSRRDKVDATTCISKAVRANRAFAIRACSDPDLLSVPVVVETAISERLAGLERVREQLHSVSIEFAEIMSASNTPTGVAIDAAWQALSTCRGAISKPFDSLYAATEAQGAMAMVAEKLSAASKVLASERDYDLSRGADVNQASRQSEIDKSPLTEGYQKAHARAESVDGETLQLGCGRLFAGVTGIFWLMSFRNVKGPGQFFDLLIGGPIGIYISGWIGVGIGWLVTYVVREARMSKAFAIKSKDEKARAAQLAKLLPDLEQKGKIALEHLRRQWARLEVCLQRSEWSMPPQIGISALPTASAQYE